MKYRINNKIVDAVLVTVIVIVTFLGFLNTRGYERLLIGEAGTVFAVLGLVFLYFDVKGGMLFQVQ